ncbi:hypothetical protein FHW96_000240 [Novosphingobium sp. SG751A]|uniref:hypothetical protein n=1 Tax=Novosphingobium sp. SG751A TaxID=2587000 RepID=UPI00155365B3|nr:hypothetical protein [Novosphingobium sp. SG751A]NOW44113.1 hypothetical protein [Novosphingobium sp. SG751A]
MSQLPPAMSAALADNRVLLFGAARIALPDYTIRLLDGSGALMIGGELYQGRDDVYGVLDTIEGIEESLSEETPTLSIGLIPATDTALAALVDPAVQGSEVQVMVGVVDLSTGQPVATPYQVFVGELDVPTITWGENDRRLEYRVNSVGERFFQIEEGRRLSSAFHQSVWPGEKGLDYCTDVEITLAWGQAVDNSVVYTRSNLPGYAETFNRT